MTMKPATPLRILQIHPLLKGDGIDPEAGGKSKLSLALSREFAREGHAVALFPYPEPILEKTFVFENGQAPIAILPPARIPTFGGSFSALRIAFALPRRDRSARGAALSAMFTAGLREAMRSFRPDIVHCHNSFSDFPLLYRTLGFRPPLILTHHTHMPGQNLDAYDRFIFSSPALAALVCGEDDARRKKTALIPPAVERLFTEADPGVTGRRRGILFVGGLRPDKGLQYLLAAYRASAALRKIPLRVCGEGPEREPYEKFVREHRLPVEFLGRTSSPQVRAELLQTKMLANPSPGEGFSLALAEAACCGVPALGWKPQVLETRDLLGMESGIAFNPAESTDIGLANTLLAGLARKDWQSPRYQTRLSAAARRYFSIERYAAEHLALYRALLNAAA